jgi:hypothetical protein
LQPIADLVLEVQQPAAATRFSLDRAATITYNDETFGLTYHQFNLGAVASGSEAAVTVSYRKDDPAPSFSREQVIARQSDQTAAGVAATSTAAHPLAATPLMMSLLILIGAAALAGVAGFAWYRRRYALAEGDRSYFCGQCGATLKEEAYFCHVCGAPMG